MPRFTTDGKFFARDGQRFFLNAVAYGPTCGPEDGGGGGLPSPERRRADLDLIAEMGLNAVRLYEPPPVEFLDECEQRGICAVIGIPWAQHIDFFADRQATGAARSRAVKTTSKFRDHPAVFAYIVGNEIAPEMVRWLGHAKVRGFLEDLVDAGRAQAPDALFSYATFPSTEYLYPRNADFLAYNIFLEDPEAFYRYVLRLHHLAGDRPLLISEFGVDTLHHGERFQTEATAWSGEIARVLGCAGRTVFSFTDDWWRGGKKVEGWKFGLTTVDRQKRPACAALEGAADPPPLPEPAPKFSIAVCTYNGEATLNACLDSLLAIDYPNYEVIVADDGSTDRTAEIVAAYPVFRHLRLAHAGLSVARNAAAAAADGEIIAYIDDDAMADPDWLRFLSLSFRDPSIAAAGGPNIPPLGAPEGEQLVAAAPGQPCHVMLDNVRAEHLPGCNLAVRKQAFEAIGGFDPQFLSAGDDVDFCWRLLDADYGIAFAPGAVVWHHPRASPSAYLRQQGGYGRAEAQLAKKHRTRFQGVGGIRWSGCIYGMPGRAATDTSLIYRGRYATAPFQSVYTPPGLPSAPASNPLWFVALAALLLGGLLFPVAWIAATAMLGSQVLHAYRWARGAELAGGIDTTKARLQIAAMAFLQPAWRGLARLRGMLSAGLPLTGSGAGIRLPDLLNTPWVRPHHCATYWADPEANVPDRSSLLDAFGGELRETTLPHMEDDGWRNHDFQIDPQPGFFAFGLATVTEYHESGAQLLRSRLDWRLRGRVVAGNVALLIFALAATRTLPVMLVLALLLAVVLLQIAVLVTHHHKQRRELLARFDALATASGYGAVET